MNLEQILEYIDLELAKISDITASDLAKYRLVRDLVADCHSKIDGDLLSRDTIKAFVSPCKNYIFNVIASEKENPVKAIKDWQKEGVNRGRTKSYFAENIQNIEGVTGNLRNIKGKEIFQCYAFDFISPDSQQWRELKEQTLTDKVIDSVTFDLDEYLQTTEKLLLSDNVYDQLTGLIASLGRRPTELFNPDSFEIISGKTHQFLFKGQLKTKKDNPDSYVIDTLFEANHLYDIWLSIINNEEIQLKLSAINELFGDDEDIKKHEMIDDRFNAILNRIVKVNYSFIPLPESLKNDQEGVSCRILRRCYATIMASREITNVRDSRMFINYCCKILGHGILNTNTTMGYLDYLPFEYENMFFQLEVPNFDIDLSLDNRKKLHFLMSESGDDINYLISKMIACYEQNKPKSITFTDTPWDELKGSNTPKSGNEKVARAVNAIIEHNESQAEQELRYCITARAIMDLTGSRHSIVKAYFDEYSELIEAHNQRYELKPVHNRGKMPINEVIIIN